MNNFCSFCFEKKTYLHTIYLEKHSITPVSEICEDCLKKRADWINEHYKECLSRTSFCEIKNYDKRYKIRLQGKFVWLEDLREKPNCVLVDLCNIRQRIVYCKAKGNMIDFFTPHKRRTMDKNFGGNKTNVDKYGVGFDE